MTMTSVKKHKIKLREVNRHLVCRLCRGYFVDATTIAECLHSFCRSCIIKYLEKNSFCPICEVQIHKTKPYLSLRLDKALQDVVYKLVPGLYHNEMARRRSFYASRPDQLAVTTPEQRGVEERLIFSPEDSISLSLEFMESSEPEAESLSSHSSESGEDFPLQLGLMKVRRVDARKESIESNEPVGKYPKRFLQCPAGVSIAILKKFLAKKFNCSSKMQIEIIHKRVPLPDHYTLMDVSYIFTWKRMAPMRLFYQFNIVKSSRQDAPLLSLLKPIAESLKTPEPPSPPPLKVEEPSPLTTIEPQEIQKDLSSETIKKEPAIVSNVNNVNTSECVLTTNGKCKPVKSKPTAEKVVDPKTEDGKEAKTDAKSKLVDPKTASHSQFLKNLLETEKAVAETPTNQTPITNPSRPASNSVPAKPIFKPIAPRPPTVDTSKMPNLPPRPPTPAVKPSIPGQKPGKKLLLLLNPESGNLEPVPTSPVKRELSEKPKSNVQLLKKFRKEKPKLDEKVEVTKEKHVVKTDTSPVKKEKIVPKANVSIEIKSDGKESEYDFESNSPPKKIMTLHEYTQSEMFKSKMPKGTMSLQDFKKQVMNGSAKDKKDSKNKNVPSLYRINSDMKSNGVVGKKAADGSPSPQPRVINIETPPEGKSQDSPPKPIKIENKGGEYSIKQIEDGRKTPKRKIDDTELTILKRQDATDEKKAKTSSPIGSPKTQKPPTPVAPAKEDQQKNILENQTGDEKRDQKMLQMLISIAQKQSIEPLLKVPNYPPGSSANNVTPNSINQALQFFQKLSSDMKVLEARSQTEQNLPPKTPNLGSFQQFYQQQMEMVKMLKRQPAMSSEVPNKVPKLSPNLEEKKSPNRDEAALMNVERTLSQIQEQAEIQSRLVAAQNYKNYPGFMQFYSAIGSPLYQQHLAQMANVPSRPPSVKSSQSSPNQANSPPGLTLEQQQLFHQQQQQFINTGLTSEMSFHQMFQKYLAQQMKMNKNKPPVKLFPPPKKSSPQNERPLPPTKSPKAVNPPEALPPPTAT